MREQLDSSHRELATVANFWQGKALYESMKRVDNSIARKRGLRLMEDAVGEAYSKLKVKYPDLEEALIIGRLNYSAEVEREGFFTIDRLRGEFSRPLKYR